MDALETSHFLSRLRPLLFDLALSVGETASWETERQRFLHAVATRLTPKACGWLDDQAGDLYLPRRYALSNIRSELARHDTSNTPCATWQRDSGEWLHVWPMSEHGRFFLAVTEAYPAEALHEITRLLQRVAVGLSVTKARETLLANTVAGIDLVRYPERIIIDANQAFVALLGYDSREEVIGKATSFLYFDPTEGQRMLDTARHILDTGQGSLRDLHVLRKDGQDLYLDVSGQRLEGEDPDHPVIVWTQIDVTERHRLHQYQSAAVLAQQELLRLNDPKAMYQRLVEIVVRGTSSICAYIATPGINGMWLQVAAIYSKNSILAQAIEQVIFSPESVTFL